jgi:hypothetical protein
VAVVDAVVVVDVVDDPEGLDHDVEYVVYAKIRRRLITSVIKNLNHSSTVWAKFCPAEPHDCAPSIKDQWRYRFDAPDTLGYWLSLQNQNPRMNVATDDVADDATTSVG